MKSIKEREAKGTEGFLMNEVGDKPYFRVYKSNGEFVDYDIFHSDLQITVTDDDAFFKGEDIAEPYLDYSNKTLGED